MDTERRFKALTIVDDYSRECPAIEVDTSLNGKRVMQTLEKLAALRGLPEVITVDNGPEFSDNTLDEWAYKNKVHLNFIRLGKPVKNAYILHLYRKVYSLIITPQLTTWINIRSAKHLQNYAGTNKSKSGTP